MGERQDMQEKDRETAIQRLQGLTAEVSLWGRHIDRDRFNAQCESILMLAFNAKGLRLPAGVIHQQRDVLTLDLACSLLGVRVPAVFARLWRGDMVACDDK